MLQAVAPRQVSFLPFCATHGLIDVEALHQMVHRQQPVHAFDHTDLGATLVIAAVALLCLALGVLGWLVACVRWFVMGADERR